jgi:LytR cell envelope-related transcriptional attenuator
MSTLKNNLSPVKKRLYLILFTVFLLVVIFLVFFLKTGQTKINAEELKPPPSVKISILNGCGVDGAAGDVKEYFIKQDLSNIDIIAWRNVDRGMFIYGKTILVSKKQDEDKMNYLIELTGIKRKIYSFDSNTIEDIQIILGSDYREFFKLENSL